MQDVTRIIGIDPGLQRTGWGVVDATGNRLSFVACGTITSDGKADLADRLLALHDGLVDVIAAHAPDEAAVEHTFVNANPTATLKLGQARGIAMLVPARAGLPDTLKKVRSITWSKCFCRKLFSPATTRLTRLRLQSVTRTTARRPRRG
jgi:hypothetical protein